MIQSSTLERPRFRLVMRPDMMSTSSGTGQAAIQDVESGTVVPKVWVVRADGGKYADHFVSGGYAAVGWFDLSSVETLDRIRRTYQVEYPDALPGQIANELGQLAAFRLEMGEGDHIITPAADRESLRYGRIVGPCVAFRGEDECGYRNRRAVNWAETPLSRSSFDESFQRTLRSPRTVFRVSQAGEFLAAITGSPDVPSDNAIGSDHGAGAEVSPVQDDAVTHIGQQTELDSERPLPGTRTGQVWDIADEVTHEQGRCAERGEVIERFEARGGNRNTASTLYYKWKQHWDARRVPATANPGSNRLPDSRIILISN